MRRQPRVHALTLLVRRNDDAASREWGVNRNMATERRVRLAEDGEDPTCGDVIIRFEIIAAKISPPA